jgi:acetyl-CoA carboxylase biotin carboxyl carrier protein
MATIELKSEIAGAVRKLLKGVGDHVEEEEAVLMMESMKMEVPLTSPEAGVVREMLVKEGDIVSDGMVVARVDV